MSYIVNREISEYYKYKIVSGTSFIRDTYAKDEAELEEVLKSIKIAMRREPHHARGASIEVFTCVRKIDHVECNFFDVNPNWMGE